MMFLSRSMLKRPARVLVHGRQPPHLSLRAESAQRRWNSARPSPTSQFYKTFTRPVAKCLLLALFTYQVTYWAWLKLEQDEIKAEREAEIAKLEAQVQSLQAAQKN
ncbi:hypothetical protein VTK73DRAFT_7404 [Phialemonium thermophilum]|uniref:Inner membrane assembly complex subunit 17 n=1 Tax=Phialemonium thermophilum TaxID=223376 RepID=A0ABR3XSZ8_9PEZI